MSTKKLSRFVMIRDAALIQHLHDVRARRGNVQLSKTAMDLLRERLMDLKSNGDPLAIRQDGRRLIKAG